ncbi:MAG: type III polyketide synthase [Deltaproteobacteria bacterium]|nr:type III polyketide synthase [Deltaproteobacteria bacterium]
MPWIHSVQCALPPHHYDQEALIAGLRKRWSEQFFNFSRIEAFHQHVLVQNRYLALPLEEYSQDQGLEFRNRVWIKVSLQLLQEAVLQLLENAALPPREIALIATTSSSGMAVPSLEARLMNLIRFSPATKRLPLFGLGCLAGVAGLNRVADYLRAYPKQAALLLSTELSSLTVQLKDFSVANLVSTGLFGDGAAAVLLVGDEHPLAKEAPLRIIEGRSEFFPDTERVMGWDVVDSGFKVVLDSSVPDVVFENFPRIVGALLGEHGLQNQDLQFYVSHPGGPKVLAAIEESLGLKNGELKLSWDSLRDYGNMSSASVLFVLRETLKQLPPKGSWGLMASMGPAFCAEVTLLRRE